MARGLLRRLILVIAAIQLSGGKTVRDVHMVGFENSNAEDVVSYTTSEGSVDFSQHVFDDLRLSSLCRDFPDCPKLVYKKYSSGTSDTHFDIVLILPLENGVALLPYQYRASLVLNESDCTVLERGCSVAAVVKTSRGVIYVVCLTGNDIRFYEVRVNYESLKDSNLLLLMTQPYADWAKLSNFEYTFSEGSDFICYADGDRIKCFQPDVSFVYEVSALNNCNKVDRLERARISGPTSELWVRCHNESTQSIDIFHSLSTNVVAPAGTFPYLCPNPDVIMEVILLNSFIRYGLSTNELRNVDLPGNSFLPDSATCFEVQNITYLAFVDDNEGVYIFDSFTSNFTKLPLKASSSEEHTYRYLLFFDDRYLHVRTPQQYILVDTHSEFEWIISQSYIEVMFVGVFSDLERDIAESQDPPTTPVFTAPISSTQTLPPVSSVAKPTSAQVASTELPPGKSSRDHQEAVTILVPTITVLCVFVLGGISLVVICCWVKSRHTKGQMLSLNMTVIPTIGTPTFLRRSPKFRQSPVGAETGDLGHTPPDGETTTSNGGSPLPPSREPPAGRSASQEQLGCTPVHAQPSIASSDRVHTALVPGILTQ